MVDRVQPLKQESAAGGGTETDLFPTETDHNEDYLDARGVTLQNGTSDDEVVLIDRDALDRLTFRDGENTVPVPLTDLIGGGGTGLPDATEVGQFLFSYDGATFAICKPIVTNDGFIVTDQDGHQVVINDY